jgi:hypothetical protein
MVFLCEAAHARTGPCLQNHLFSFSRLVLVGVREVDNFQIPPDLVVKRQGIDIAEVISLLI